MTILSLVVAVVAACLAVVVEGWVTTVTPSATVTTPLVMPTTTTRVSSHFGVDRRQQRLVLHQSSSSNAEDDAGGGEEGANLAAEFFKLAQQKGIGLDASDLLDEDDDEEDADDIDDDEEVPNIPQGAVNAFLGYDTGDVGDKLAGNVSLTNDQLYSEVKERVLDTAGGFVEYVKGAREDEGEEGDDDDDDEDDDAELGAPKPYSPPTTVPDAELTAGEVVLQVLQSLRNNNVPTANAGVEILFGFSSPSSPVKTTEAGLTAAEYADFLQDTEYKVLLDPSYGQVSIEKADYSANGKKAFFTARLTHTQLGVSVNVNFILSSVRQASGSSSSAAISGEDVAASLMSPTAGASAAASSSPSTEDCWLIDSILIRPESMRRRRRR